MGSQSRKGLKRHGLRHYIVDGPSRAVLIERAGQKQYRVRPDGFPAAFFYGQYKLLRTARQYAEELASIDTFPEPAMPVCLRRFKP